jgi:hypothetical protein
MATNEIPRSEWKSYFNRVSKTLDAKEAEIGVAGLDIGDQIEAEWVRLAGITYDPKDDVISLVTEKLDHMIRHPQAVYVEAEIDGLHSMEVTDGEDHKRSSSSRPPWPCPSPNRRRAWAPGWTARAVLRSAVERPAATPR